MLEWYDKRGIDVQTTALHPPESNGKAERANWTIKDPVRAALSKAHVSKELWAEAAVAAIYVMSRSAKADQDLTLWEMFTRDEPDVSILVV